VVGWQHVLHALICESGPSPAEDWRLPRAGFRSTILAIRPMTGRPCASGVTPAGWSLFRAALPIGRYKLPPYLCENSVYIYAISGRLTPCTCCF